MVAELAGVVESGLETRRPFGVGVAEAVALRVVGGALVGRHVGTVLNPIGRVVLPLVDTVLLGQHPRRVARVGQITCAVGRYAVVDRVLVEGVVGELRGDAQTFGDEVQIVAQFERSLQVAARAFAETRTAQLTEHVVAVVVVGVEQVASVLLEIALIDFVAVVGQYDRQVGRLRVGQRDDVGRRGAGIGILRHAGTQIDRDFQPFGGVDVDVGAEVIAQEVVGVVGVGVLVVAALLVVASQDEVAGAVRAAAYREAVILQYRGLERIVEIIPVVTQPVGVVAFGAAVVVDRRLREERRRVGRERGVVVEHRLVVERRVVGRSEVVGVADRFADAHRGLEVDGRFLALAAALGRHDDHAVGAADTVGCRRRCVFEDREGLDLVGSQIAHVALDTVDDHDDARLSVGRDTADVELCGVVARLAAGELVHQQTRHTSGQRVVDVGRGRLFEVFGRDRGDRTGDRLLFLDVVTHDDDLFERLAVFEQRDVDLRAVVHVDLLRCVTDVGDHQRRAAVGDVDAVTAVGVRHGAEVRTLDDKGHADHRVALVVLDESLDRQFRRLSLCGRCRIRLARRGHGGLSQAKQTQYQC